MNLLIVDDDRVTRELLAEVFEAEEFSPYLASSAEDALKIFSSQEFRVVLSDIRMLDLDGIGLLSQIKTLRPSTIVILMTGFGTMDGAISAIQKGAFDYVSKPFEIPHLKSVLQRARKEAQRDSRSKTNRVPTPPKTLLGKSSKIVEVYKLLARATLSPSNVLIQGESGTGKELVARAIHEHSNRSEKPFVAVNCGALAETLLESELFGHAKGAFTGAFQAKSGLLAEADGGTLFLDEIGDVSSSLQVKLLRAIQEGEFKPVGTNETFRVDVRIIAATHRNLEASVLSGAFREDLYYRLKVILIEIPPLRERIEDLAELLNYFLARFAEKMQKPVSHVSEDAMKLLLQYHWPGNIRELEHAIERAVTMTSTSILYPDDFPPEIWQPSEKANEVGHQNSLDEIEKSHISRVLRETGFNKSKTASLLQIDRKTLDRKLKRYAIAKL